MKNKGQDTRFFSRRAFVLGGLKLSLLGVLAGRLAWLQIAQGERYKVLSDKNRINIKMLAPSRGRIVDRFGVPLAVNHQNFRVAIIPEQTQDLEKSLRVLQGLIDIDEDDVQRVIKKSKKQAKYVPIEVKDSLEWEDVSKIEVNLPDLPGIFTEAAEVRSYPLGESTAHIVGYVGYVTQSELEEDPVLSLPGFRIGKTGIEKGLDQSMRGSAGVAQVEVNVLGREVRELNRQEGVPGRQIVMSIDAGLQSFMQERLAQEKSASGVVMDARTGAVYALASHPSFDPNIFTGGLSAEMWEELLANPGNPLTNKAVAGQYPPASTFKMVTALAGLESGTVVPGHSVYCPGHYDYGNNRFHCWKFSGHGSVDLVDALMVSCDTYFYDVSKDIGIEKIAKMARALGLGEKLGFDLREERPGLVPDKDWKMGHLGNSWKVGETIVASIGQGYLLSTPLQLAVMTARLVNGGYAVKPWIVNDTSKVLGEGPLWPKLNFNSANLALIKKGMDKVVMDKEGTAHGSRIHKAEWAMGGKTGTAQVKKITMQQRMQGVRNEDLPWKQRHHALFVGYAPLDNPRYICAVVVEHGVSGAATAAPMARDLLTETQRRDPAAKPAQVGNEKTAVQQEAPQTQKKI